MTKKELSQLYYLNREISQDKQRLSELETFSTGTAPKITGLPHVGGISNKTAIAAEVADIKKSIEAKISLSVVEYNRLNRYIATLEDPLIRQIIALRFINGLTWHQVECSVGGNNKAESLRKKLDRHLENIK